MEKNILNEINKIKFFMSYKQGLVISEQKNSKLILEDGDDPTTQVATNPPKETKFTDWSKKGKVNWENAKIKDIINYIEEVDSSIDPSIANVPSYEIMMDWYRENDSPDTRKSLKNWMFGNVYYGLTLPENVKQTKKNTVEKSKFDKNLQTNLSNLMGGLDLNALKDKIDGLADIDNNTKKTYKKNIDTLITNRTVEKVKKEMDALTLKNIILPINDLKNLQKSVENLSNIQSGKLTKGVNLSTYFDTLNTFTTDTKNKGDMAFDDDLSGAKIDVDLKNSGTAKKSLLMKLQQDVDKIEIENFKKILKKITSIDISDEPQQLEVFRMDKENETIITQSETMTPIYNFPPADQSEQDRNNLGNTFFPDDGTTLSPDVMEGIRNLLRSMEKVVEQLENEVAKERAQYNLSPDKFDLKIISFNVFTYASTSKVRTRYKSEDKTFSEKNNIQLAEDRCDVIYNFIKNAIISNKRLSRITNDVVYTSKATKPNVGPGWQKLDGVDVNGQQVPITEYGELFQEAYAKNNKLTPQMFYGARNSQWAANASKLLGKTISQQQLNMEYNDVYGPYRMNLAGISMTIVKPSVVTKENVGEDYLAFAVPGLGVQLVSKKDIDLTTTWRDLKRGIRKFRKKLKRSFANMGPDTIPVIPKFTGRTTDCPKW